MPVDYNSNSNRRLPDGWRRPFSRIHVRPLVPISPSDSFVPAALSSIFNRFIDTNVTRESNRNFHWRFPRRLRNCGKFRDFLQTNRDTRFSGGKGYRLCERSAFEKFGVLERRRGSRSCQNFLIQVPSGDAKRPALFSDNSVSLYLRVDTQVCGYDVAAARGENISTLTRASETKMMAFGGA